MSHSLRDKLLNLGFKASPKPEPKPTPTPARISHHPSAADADPLAVTGRTPSGRLDVVSATPAPSSGPCAPPQRRLDALATKCGEKCGPAKAPPKRAAGAPATHPPGQRAPARSTAKTPRSQDEIDLAKAYAIRAQKEKDERLAAERAQQELARLRREAKSQLAQLLKDSTLNDPAADIARHFEYGGKIKRIHVTAEQLKALNAGELGVVQANGRYLLVSAEILARAASIFPAAVALRVDPDAPASDAGYSEPHDQIPDDLVW